MLEALEMKLDRELLLRRRSEHLGEERLERRGRVASVAPACPEQLNRGGRPGVHLDFEITDDEVIFRNYQGKRFTYKQPRQLVPLASPGIAAESDVVPIEAGKAAKKKRVARNRKSANG